MGLNDGTMVGAWAPIPDAPADLPGYVPFSVELLGVIREERGLDRREWECVEGL